MNGGRLKNVQFPCRTCPLRANPIFRDFTKTELDFVERFKTGELTAAAQSVILREGAASAHLYTVLSGVGFRYKSLPDGGRQILNFVFPGDLIGLQGAVAREMQHSVEALTDVILCVFERERIWKLYESYPSLAFDITWLASREERFLDEHLLNVGRRSAMKRIAYLVMHLHTRVVALRMNRVQAKHEVIEVPLTQQHIADALGLSLVHTNKSLRKLERMGLIGWSQRMMVLPDLSRLKALADWDNESETIRPLI